MTQEPSTNAFDVPSNADALQTLIEDPFDGGRVKKIEEFAVSRSTDEIDRFVRGVAPGGLDFKENSEYLVDLLKKIDDDRSAPIEVPPQLQGIGGFATYSVLQTLLQGVICKRRGKIRDFIYLPDKEQGHLSVDVWSECSGGSFSGIQQIEFLHWDIEITNGFVVHARDEENTEDPFPTVSLELPDEAKDRNNPFGIWMRNLNRKIHARGASILIHRVYQRIGHGNLVLLPEAHRYYQSNEGSCIDLMVSVSPPQKPVPTTYGELPQKPVGSTAPDQLGYCLGRCEHPAIVNTDTD